MEPSTIVAVLGGGQLGRMLALAGRPLGLHFRFLDPTADASAGAFGELVVGDLGDHAAVADVARGASVVTYEWEGVPAGSARAAAVHAPVRPDHRALEVAQDRLVEKQTFGRLGVGVTEFVGIDDVSGLRLAVEEIGLPAVLKTRRGGYDGKGQRVLRDPADLEPAGQALGSVPLVLERFVPFTRELSILAARGLDGTTRCWPLVENLHADGILRLSRAPAPGTEPELQTEGERIATCLLDELDYIGVLAVELFEHDGGLLANELAPRVHNSGHWTIEGAETSQFEQHVRAVLGWPLGSPAARGHTAMVNCIGTMPEPAAVLAVEGAHLHDYEKQPRAGRKLGHVTVLAPSREDLEHRLEALKRAAPGLFAW